MPCRGYISLQERCGVWYQHFTYKCLVATLYGWFLVGITVVIILLQQVEHSGQQQQLSLWCQLSRKEHSQDGVELRKS